MVEIYKDKSGAVTYLDIEMGIYERDKPSSEERTPEPSNLEGSVEESQEPILLI